MAIAFDERESEMRRWEEVNRFVERYGYGVRLEHDFITDRFKYALIRTRPYELLLITHDGKEVMNLLNLLMGQAAIDEGE